jgi:hypothetical protein
MIVSQISTEAEYKAMTDATAEVMWVQSVLHKLRTPCPQSARLRCGNIWVQSILPRNHFFMAG